MEYLVGRRSLNPFIINHQVSFADYNDTFKRRRRLMQRALGARIIPSYHSWIQASTSLFIKDLLRSPEQYIAITRKYAAGLTSSVIYGYELKSADDRLLIQSEDCLNILSNEIAAEGGVWMVDMFPVLKYLPSWLPGAGFKRRAEVLKKRFFTLAEEPFKFVKMKLRQVSALAFSALGRLFLDMSHLHHIYIYSKSINHRHSARSS